MRHMSKQKFEL